MVDRNKARVWEVLIGEVVVVKSLEVLMRLFLVVLAATTISSAFADATTNRILLPIEVLHTNDATASRTAVLQRGQADSARSLWLQIHGLRYAEQASVQVNASAWIPLSNTTVTVTEPGRSFGGIGGGFSTLVMTLSLPKGTVLDGTNTIRFRFNHTDGLVSSYRVLALNFLTIDGQKLLAEDAFEKDAPETWTPPLPDEASIRAGRELWQTASLVASSLPDSHAIHAHCADCHAYDGRDLKYFNFSNDSIVARSQFHGLSTLQGEQIASYIRSLPFPNPGRPWNPPYQPGPGLDEQPVSNWAAGAGLAWVLDQDTDALPYLFGQQEVRLGSAATKASASAPNLRELVGLITPDRFRPDGNLNPRQIPIALQLPDWSGWLPRVHPKDAWGLHFEQSQFARLYADESVPESISKVAAKTSLRTVLEAAQAPNYNGRPVVAAFVQWSQARRTFLRQFVNGKTAWSPDMANKVYSTQLWQLVKTWEMTQEFGLEGRGHDLFGPGVDSRTWCNTIPSETAPSDVRIPDGPAGIGGSALTNEYFAASWYELQIILNSGHHQHRNRSPVDWVYVIGGFHELYSQTHHAEPARLLVVVIKALQSTDPNLGPDNLSQGWRPDQNIDPRIMVSPVWAPIFNRLPHAVHQAITASLLAAWMDKNQQYSMAAYLPPSRIPQASYSAPLIYGNITGGRVWEAAPQFRQAGVSAELVARLQNWGIVYTDRAARIQYEGASRH